MMATLFKEWGSFTQVPNKLIEDNELSSTARFVFVYMASRPDGWKFRTEQLAKMMSIGVKTLRKYISELEARGWVERKQLTTSGKFSGNSYELKLPGGTIAPCGKIYRAVKNGRPKIAPLNNKDSNNTELNKINNTEKGLFPKVTDLYFDFYKKRNGVKPKFTARDGQAQKSLIAYFKGVVSNPDDDELILDCFRAVFDNWHLLDNFMASRIKMCNISDDITNIIAKIKLKHSHGKITNDDQIERIARMS